MKKTLSTLAIASGLVLAATGCTVGTETAGPAPEVTQSPASAGETSTPANAAESSSTSAPGTSTSAPAEAAPSSSDSSPAPEVEEQLAGFGETWEYEDGIAVTVTHEGAAQASQYAAGAEETGGQMHVFTISIKNGTDAIFDPVGAYTTVNYGEDGQVAERVFDTQNGYGDMWQGKILPGKKQTLTMAFAIPTDKSYEALLSVAPGFSYKDALFHGTVGK
ncbi:MAG TPA: hypothetical protein VFI97_06415 [Arthrobacter sp.]|nr:hypothetical protein [Arthrobacter sp.]